MNNVQFVRINSDIYQASSIKSGRLTSEKRPFTDRSFETTRDFTVFTLTFLDGTSVVYSGSGSSEEATMSGLRAYNQFCEQVLQPAEKPAD